MPWLHPQVLGGKFRIYTVTSPSGRILIFAFRVFVLRLGEVQNFPPTVAQRFSFDVIPGDSSSRKIFQRDSKPKRHGHVMRRVAPSWSRLFELKLFFEFMIGEEFCKMFITGKTGMVDAVSSLEASSSGISVVEIVYTRKTSAYWMWLVW